MINVLKVIYIIFSFGFIDVWLRVLTRWLNLYNIYELAPNLFTLCWAIILAVIVLLIPNKLIGRILYAGIYFLSGVYAVVQYGYYLIFDKFLFFSDFLFAGEGGDYTPYIWDIVSIKVVACVIFLIAIGMIGIIIFPEPPKSREKMLMAKVVVIAVAILGVFSIPKLYGEAASEKAGMAFNNPALEYNRFVNSAFDMQLTGMYQYVAKDAVLNIQKAWESDEVDQNAVQQITTYFDNKESHIENDMTGIFKDKNVIIVMMESVDDWLITKEDMPTLYYMMQNGIQFSNIYTPAYSSGYTFNTESSFNTSVYPFSNGNVAYTLVENDYGNSLANVFAEHGYSVNSYHNSSVGFYNRGEMHEAWGYEKFNSYYNYAQDGLEANDDTFLYLCEDLYRDVTSDEPFMSFVITISAHLPYTVDDDLSQYALKKYPEYAQGEITEEDIIRAKARMTDDMFAGLLKRLEEDGLLEDTVIVGYGDHYSYGITDEEFLQRVSEEAGNSILENTPAFIYCASMEDKAMVVDKVMQITDLAPTIENMFGFAVPKEIMGSDVFADNYKGYAIFPNNTWVTNEAYVKNGAVVYNNGMSEEELFEMNQFVQETYVVNDYILETDYYSLEQ